MVSQDNTCGQLRSPERLNRARQTPAVYHRMGSACCCERCTAYVVVVCCVCNGVLWYVCELSCPYPNLWSAFLSQARLVNFAPYLSGDNASNFFGKVSYSPKSCPGLAPVSPNQRPISASVAFHKSSATTTPNSNLQHPGIAMSQGRRPVQAEERRIPACKVDGVTTLHPDPTSTMERRTAVFSVDSFTITAVLWCCSILQVFKRLSTSVSLLGPLTAVFLSSSLKCFLPVCWLHFVTLFVHSPMAGDIARVFGPHRAANNVHSRRWYFLSNISFEIQGCRKVAVKQLGSCPFFFEEAGDALYHLDVVLTCGSSHCGRMPTTINLSKSTVHLVDSYLPKGHRLDSGLVRT